MDTVDPRAHDEPLQFVHHGGDQKTVHHLHGLIIEECSARVPSRAWEKDTITGMKFVALPCKGDRAWRHS